LPPEASGVREALLPRCSEASSERIGTPEVSPTAAPVPDER
jgi:hypothetical protein